MLQTQRLSNQQGKKQLDKALQNCCQWNAVNLQSKSLCHHVVRVGQQHLSQCLSAEVSWDCNGIGTHQRWVLRCLIWFSCKWTIFGSLILSKGLGQKPVETYVLLHMHWVHSTCSPLTRRNSAWYAHKLLPLRTQHSLFCSQSQQRPLTCRQSRHPKLKTSNKRFHCRFGPKFPSRECTRPDIVCKESEIQCASWRYAAMQLLVLPISIFCEWALQMLERLKGVLFGFEIGKSWKIMGRKGPLLEAVSLKLRKIPLKFNVIQIHLL